MGEFILETIEQQRSKMNNVRMWRLRWYCIDDGKRYETTVDTTYRNFRRNGWDHMVDDPEPWGLYTGLRPVARVTNEGIPVITADSQPRLQHRLEKTVVEQIIEVDQKERNPQPFDKFFDND